MDLVALNITDAAGSEVEIGPLYDEAVNNGVIDAVINQYLGGLGEFDTDKYLNSPVILWIFFVTAAIATQLMFLNMLVAVMGKTLGETQENKQ